MSRLPEAGAAGPDRTAAPAVGPPRDFAVPVPDVRRLGNGLDVWLVPGGPRSLGFAQLVVRGGASVLTPGEAGLASLVADLLDEGATLGDRTLSTLDVSLAADRLGGRLRSGATYDMITASLEVAEPRLPQALELLAAVTVRPTFPAAEIERVRALQIGRLLESGDEPRWLADQALRGVLYGPDDPYGQPLLGEVEDLEAADRGRIDRFHRRYFVPDNAVLLVVSDRDPDELVSAVEEGFEGWTGSAAPTSAEAPDPPPVERRIHVVDKPGAPQSEIRVGAVGVARSTPDYFPLTVLNTVLGGAFTSRLNTVLREEKGYTYGAFSRFQMGSRPSPFEARTAVHTPVTADAVADILREIERLRDECVPDDELERAKRYTALRLPGRFETAAGRADRMAGLALHGLAPDTFGGYVEGILGVTAGDVRRAARDHLDAAGLAVVIAGDFETIAGPLGTLHLGEVVRRGAPS